MYSVASQMHADVLGCIRTLRETLRTLFEQFFRAGVASSSVIGQLLEKHDEEGDAQEHKKKMGTKRSAK